MKYLIVVAHPDDEVLGAGASIWKWSHQGDVVDVCIMCSEAKARAFRPDDNELDADKNNALDYLGINKVYEGTFPNIEMNAIPHLELVQFVETAIKESEPDIIITHHTADTNNDHLQTSLACQAAMRLFQRRPEIKPLQEFWYMEVGSATDWNVNPALNIFRPNIFVEVGKSGVEAKIKALNMYRGVMRPYPHPRSNEAMEGFLAVRGSQAGFAYAEAFECAMRRINTASSEVPENKPINLSLAHMGGKEQEFVKEAFDRHWVAPLGPNVDGFEADLEGFLGEQCGSRRVAALSSGTAAVHLGMIELGVQAGDEVICQSFTFCASVNPAMYLGAKPVLVDSERLTYNMDPELLEVAIKDRIARTGRKPKAIVLVHLYGMPSQMDRLLEIAGRYDIPVLEDAAEALGSSFDGRLCGTFGEFGVWSFNGNKMITTSGGGALVCPNEEARRSAVFYATQAREPLPYYQHEKAGFNYRLSNVCAGIGRGQMLVLREHLKHHRRMHQFYVEAFDGMAGVTVHSAPDRRMDSNYWLTTIQLDAAAKVVVDGVESQVRSVPSEGGQTNDNVEQLRVYLAQQGIETRALWKPLHCMPLFARGSQDRVVGEGVICREAPQAVSYVNGVSESIFRQGLCLPSGPCVSEKDAQKVVECVKRVVKL